MRKLFYILLFLVFGAWPAGASVYDKPSDHGIPACNDSHLIDNVRAAAAAEYAANLPANALEKRRQILMLKDLQGFAEVPTENFLPKQNFNVAKKLITLKINQHMADGDIRLCKSTGMGPSKGIYLVIYYQDYEVLVDMADFSPKKDDFIIKYTTKN